MKKANKCILWFIGGISVFVGLILISAVFAGYWLKMDNKPVQADAIIVLSGEPLRAFYAAELYRKGYADHVYISRQRVSRTIQMLEEIGIVIPHEEELYRNILIKKGVPDKNIQIFGKASVSTIEEAEILKQLFKGPKCQLLVVTSPHHAKRAEMIIKDILIDCYITVVGTPYDPFKEKWWTDKDSAVNLILEISKILFYKFGGGFRSN